jgi:hypothetical protein
MDFVHRPKIKILKILKIKITTSRKLVLLPSSGELRRRREEHLLCWAYLHHWTTALSKGPNIIGVILFSPSFHLRTEAEPASETLRF